MRISDWSSDVCSSDLTSITHVLAPMTMIAFDWPGVLRIWAATLVVIAFAFWFLTKDDPTTVARRKGSVPAVALAVQIKPIRRLQVWRFSTYYFFTFGAYVALSLWRSEEHTSELQSLMRISYAVFCLKKKTK